MNNEANIQSSPGDQSRDRIVAAARARFRRFGYAKTAMQEIAADCGMSAANLYRFYDGKLAIGAAVAAADQAAQLAECDRAVAAAPGDPAEQLIALFLANIDATRQRLKRTPLLFELTLTVVREKPELRRNFLREVEQRIDAILTSDPRGRALTAKTRGRLIQIASAPFILPWLLQNEPFGDPRPLVVPLVRCLLAGLTASPPVAAEPTARFG